MTGRSARAPAAERVPEDPVRAVARAVLYEGYLLWPYRRSALKNQKRWTFGGIHPRDWCLARGGDDPFSMRVECLIEAPPDARVDVDVRFLQVVERRVALREPSGLRFVDSLELADGRILAWDEAIERARRAGGLPLRDLTAPRITRIEVAAGQREEVVGVDSGTESKSCVREASRAGELPASELAGGVEGDEPASSDAPVEGVIVRSWDALQGTIAVDAQPLARGLYRLCVEVINTTHGAAGDRQEVMRRSFASAHAVLSTSGGQFVSATDPPDALRSESEACRQVGVWPVLVGEEGDRHTVLASPIILEDYPRIAPESPGDLFDASEIDQLLVLSILAMGEEERREMRASDPRAREILDRVDALPPDALRQLHGTIRQLRPVDS